MPEERRKAIGRANNCEWAKTPAAASGPPLVSARSEYREGSGLSHRKGIRFCGHRPGR
jgi:hypothetical protein